MEMETEMETEMTISTSMPTAAQVETFSHYDRSMQELYNNLLLKICRTEISSIVTAVQSLNNRTFTNTNNKERVGFLYDTVVLARDYVEKQLSTQSWHLCRSQLVFNTLLTAFYVQIMDITKMFTELASGKFQITCNFDIFDTSLRRYCDELRALVPADPIVAREFDPPSADGEWTDIMDPRVINRITDPNAMAAWIEAFGAGVSMVPFDKFFDELIRPAFSEAVQNPRFVNRLRYHINFPRDDIVTTWRFQNLVSTFGPWNQLAINFTQFALNPGFVGMVNMFGAEELLQENRQYLTCNTILMRCSRGKPEVLAFTTIDITTGKFEQYRNVDTAGGIIPIGAFLKTFPGYELAKIGLDDGITTVTNTFAFAQNTATYVENHYRTPRKQ